MHCPHGGRVHIRRDSNYVDVVFRLDEEVGWGSIWVVKIHGLRAEQLHIVLKSPMPEKENSAGLAFTPLSGG